MNEMNFNMPPWGYWTIEKFGDQFTKDHNEILDNSLGWDITDFGSGNFNKQGLLLFTLRNGNPAGGYKSYAEKIMIVEENQVTPMHHHNIKTEDIINRGGGNLVMKLYAVGQDHRLSDANFTIRIDGMVKSCKAGESIILHPGESICLTPNIYHEFYAERGSGKVLTGEVSTLNDDSKDNIFLNQSIRFPEIDEDEPIQYPLAKDYRTILTSSK